MDRLVQPAAQPARNDQLVLLLLAFAFAEALLLLHKRRDALAEVGAILIWIVDDRDALCVVGIS